MKFTSPGKNVTIEKEIKARGPIASLRQPNDLPEASYSAARPLITGHACIVQRVPEPFLKAG